MKIIWFRNQNVRYHIIINILNLMWSYNFPPELRPSWASFLTPPGSDAGGEGRGQKHWYCPRMASRFLGVVGAQGQLLPYGRLLGLQRHSAALPEMQTLQMSPGGRSSPNLWSFSSPLRTDQLPPASHHPPHGHFRTLRMWPVSSA